MKTFIETFSEAFNETFNALLHATTVQNVTLHEHLAFCRPAEEWRAQSAGQPGGDCDTAISWHSAPAARRLQHFLALRARSAGQPSGDCNVQTTSILKSAFAIRPRFSLEVWCQRTTIWKRSIASEGLDAPEGLLVLHRANLLREQVFCLVSAHREWLSNSDSRKGGGSGRLHKGGAGGLRPAPPFVVSFVLALKTGHISMWRRPC